MARSYSVACPTDSWMVSHRLDGSITRSYRPGSTDGATAFSASHPGNRASSPSQSQPVPVRYSKPRAAGGASELMVSNPPPSRSTVVAVSDGAVRTRCWSVEVPARSA